VSSVACTAPVVQGGGVIEIASDADRIARDGQLARRAQAGDVSAFEQLYRENFRRVYALCYRLTASADLAEELTQEVFVRAWQKLGSFRGESAFSSWLHPLATNVAFSEYRSRRRREARVSAVEDLSDVAGEAPAPHPSGRIDLQKAMETLPDGAREVFVLHDAYGYKHTEIGALLGIASGTSKAQLHRARRLLKEALGR
jgi:RNA polymerase sigma-70 factor (ECF subfamily)